ncbi:MAG: phosphopantetheine-binding protein [Lamprobacter sp.]|uniref:phosphopantetheine-binding protein n=1 Tax=Lamprobacter sp. TaxID=3100796 RepID=UPI002B263BA1|nr:phosphopantetheine-binding protein [Lamprobacter sp.]MEA3642917.1 phosphopantetheine-binding protein [Lamprobacter sp.]
MEENATTHATNSVTSLEQVEALVIRTLHLEEVGVTTIDPDDALFGSGLGLDSIDALELALAISKEYGLTISSEDPNIQQIFASLRHLAAHIATQQIATQQGA